MSRPKRPPRPRTLARQRHAANEKLVQAERKLFALEPGGSPERPLDIPSAAVIEPKARSARCPRCDEPFELAAHEAHTDEHGRLREVRLACRSCGERRSLWFRISAPS
jgi:hypothetical protein